MTDKEIVAALVDMLQQFPTGIDELVGPRVWKALIANGHVEGWDE